MTDRTKTDRNEYIVLRKFLEKEKMYGSGKGTIQNTGRSDGFYKCCIQIWVQHGSEEEQQKIVDAKSLLGILALGLENVLELCIYSDEDCDEVVEAISRYVVA